MWNQVVCFRTYNGGYNEFKGYITSKIGTAYLQKIWDPSLISITQRYHYIVVCTLGCRDGIYCIDVPWAYLDGWNKGQGQCKGNHIFTFCRSYSDHSERKICICVGNTWPWGTCLWIFCFCFMFRLFYITKYLSAVLFPFFVALSGVGVCGWELCIHIKFPLSPDFIQWHVA